MGKKILDPDLKRINPSTILFNNKEKAVIQSFCRKYKVKNKSKFMREAIITAILKQLDDDYPTLFDDGKPNLFNHKYK